MPEILAVPYAISSFRVTPEETTQSLVTTFLPDQIRSAFQENVSQILLPDSIDFQIRRVDREASPGSRPHLHIQWNLKWKAGDPNAPQMGQRAISETAKSPIGTNPFNL